MYEFNLTRGNEKLLFTYVFLLSFYCFICILVCYEILFVEMNCYLYFILFYLIYVPLTVLLIAFYCIIFYELNLILLLEMSCY